LNEQNFFLPINFDDSPGLLSREGAERRFSFSNFRRGPAEKIVLSRLVFTSIARTRSMVTKPQRFRSLRVSSQERNAFTLRDVILDHERHDATGCSAVKTEA